MMKYDTDILPKYLRRVLTRENLPEADRPEHAKQEKRLFLGEETQKRERRGTEQNPLCNHVMFQRATTKSKGRVSRCQREGNEGHSAAHGGGGGGGGEKPHLLVTASALGIASNRLFIMSLMYLSLIFFPSSKALL